MGIFYENIPGPKVREISRWKEVMESEEQWNGFDRGDEQEVIFLQQYKCKKCIAV